ncbi:MAG: hypothetical protein LBK45_05560, partial [Tannerellaceae bacterium]|nr:hypothetical protein [Tannerellaceae bacterium]
MSKTKYLIFCFFSLFTLLFAGCKTKSADSEGVPFSPYVEAFTSGKVSRYATVYLVFNQEVSSEKMVDTELAKRIKIKPEVKGTFAFENNKTISFKPSAPLHRDTEYNVSADMSAWFDATGEDKVFTFKLTTLPLTVRANQEAVNINPGNENGYDIVYTLSTPDRETPETIESLIKLSEKAETKWTHNADEKTHQLTIVNLAGASEVRDFTLSIAPNKSGVKEEEIITTSIPAENEFAVYEVRYNKEPERYVEVTFTHSLDETQSLAGLAYITGNQNETVTTNGNKLRLYPDNKRVGVQTIFLSGSIRSKSQRSLGEDQEEDVEITDAMPDVRFTGEGTIIPQSKDLNIPFQAVSLRGVIVRVIKIFEKNVGQFLQYSTLDGTNELTRVGRLVIRKTILFDEEESKLSDWHTYALNLTELITPEPGAIYRIELSFNRDLSVYPCDNGNKKTKEQLLAEDEELFRKEINRYDGDSYYYYYGEVDYDTYNYDEKENPCADSYYFNKVTGKNVLVTNLGLMAKMGTDNDMLVIAHNLITTYPERAVNISLYNFQHQVIGSGITDDKGQVKIPLTHGRPYYVIASLDKQRSYMRIDQGSSLSLSTFDVAGEVVQKGIKGFIYGDRGVWRPGDTLFL